MIVRFNAKGIRYLSIMTSLGLIDNNTLMWYCTEYVELPCDSLEQACYFISMELRVNIHTSMMDVVRRSN